jgi:hypothetical protein
MAAALPADWMPKVRMDRIILHWTAGGHKANATDRKHYHVIFNDDGTPVRGNRSIADNVPPLKNYAAHTRGSNSYSIGLSVACMAGAKEGGTFGTAPMTRAQFEAMCRAAAQLCRRYQIPITPKTVLWHAEVQGTLGIPQAGKWDATVLPFEPKVRGARAVGDYTRDVIRAFMAGEKPAAPAPAPVPKPKPVPAAPAPAPAAPPKAGGSPLGWIAAAVVVIGLLAAGVLLDPFNLF